MNSKWHLYISFSKSIIRITGCVLGILLNSLIILATAFGVAEVLGILEEIKDNRWYTYKLASINYPN